MPPRYILLPSAQEDICSIVDYIAFDNPLRALSFGDELEHFIVTIVDFPKRYPTQRDLAEDIRLAPYGAYHIYYMLNGTDIIIIRVLHAARDATRIFNP